MFNEEIKQEYIKIRRDNASLPETYLERELNNCSGKEEYYGKDICNFSTPEIIDYYKEKGMRSLDSLIVLNNMFSQYARFCIEKGLVKDNQDHFRELTNEILITCVNNWSLENSIITRETLNEWCNLLLNDGDRFVLLCLFEGICGEAFKDIYFAKWEDFDQEKMIMHTPFSHRDVPITASLLSAADASNTCYEGYQYNGNKIITLKETNRILKAAPQSKLEGTDIRIRTLIYARISRCLKHIGVWNYTNASTIMDSGKIDMFNRIAKEKGISGKDALYDNSIKSLVEKQYDKSIVRSTFILKYGKFLID